MPCTITMVPSQPMPWQFVNIPCNFSMSWESLLPAPRCFMIPALPISVCLMGNTSSQMQGSPPALPYLFHSNVVHDITFPNGVMFSYGVVSPLLECICNLHFTGPPPEKNCSTYNMPGLGTSSRENLG